MLINPHHIINVNYHGKNPMEFPIDIPSIFSSPASQKSLLINDISPPLRRRYVHHRPWWHHRKLEGWQ